MRWPWQRKPEEPPKDWGKEMIGSTREDWTRARADFTVSLFDPPRRSDDPEADFLRTFEAAVGPLGWKWHRMELVPKDTMDPRLKKFREAVEEVHRDVESILSELRHGTPFWDIVDFDIDDLPSYGFSGLARTLSQLREAMEEVAKVIPEPDDRDEYDDEDDQPDPSTEPCTACDGSREVNGMVCLKCNGTGKEPRHTGSSTSPYAKEND